MRRVFEAYAAGLRDSSKMKFEMPPARCNFVVPASPLPHECGVPLQCSRAPDSGDIEARACQR